MIVYLKVENGILREKLGNKRIRLNENQRCRLAAAAARPGKDVLRGVTDLVGPEGGEAYGDLAMFQDQAKKIMRTLVASLEYWIA